MLEVGCMLRWTLIFGGLLIMMGSHARSEALFYYFRLEDQVPENRTLPGLTAGPTPGFEGAVSIAE